MCGCDRRRRRLNDLAPGLGDAVAVVAEPIKEAWMRTSKPVLFAAGFVVGAFVVPWVLAEVRRVRP